MGNIRYCRQCGHALSDESRFCEYCGAKVEREVPRTQRPQESGVFSPRGDGSAQRQNTRREPGTDEQGSRRVPVSNAQTRIDAENACRPSGVGDAGSRRTPVQSAQPRRDAENTRRPSGVGDAGSRRTPVQNAQPRRGAENTRRQPGAGEQQRRMPQDTGERRTRYQQERLQGSWEESWNRELPEENERRITPVQYLLLGLIAILIVALVALGLFWMKGRSGKRNAQDGGNVQVAQTETVKTTAGEDSGGDSVITILDEDGQAQSGTTKQTAAAETPKDQNAATEKKAERVTEKQTEKITEKQTEAVEDPTKQTQAQSGSYILPQSSERLLTDSDVDGMSYEELQMAINEIYARHGRKFSSQSVQNYFDGQSWYQGTVEPDDFSDSVFSQIESQNVLFLLKKMGIE
ncbi:MAG: YARHG domain-containing protein [Lachnospiraceae bacterium]